jgi:hypothetical protein
MLGYKKICSSLGFTGLLTVELMGKSGDLALLWNHSVLVDILNYSVRHISAGVSLVGSDYQSKFTGVYGDPDRGLREMSWKLLSHLSSYSPRD